MTNQMTNQNIINEESKSGLPTMSIIVDGKKNYIHSKYNPKEESEKLIDNMVNHIEDNDIIIFWGLGLGYHIEAYLKRFPEKYYIIIEPHKNMLINLIHNRGINSIINDKLKKIFILDYDKDAYKSVEDYLHQFDSVFFIVLPSYERIFADEYREFYLNFGFVMEDFALKNRTKKLFQKTWTKNVLLNYSQIINSKYIFNMDRDIFLNKPAILVSAGPSLEYELSNLKYIKQNKLAYIFSAGSAISALVENNIYPDAAWSIDPGEVNVEVFQKVIEKEITAIPLVFATTVGYGTPQAYPGEKLYFITDKDKISPWLIKYDKASGLKIVQDASSVAVVALEALINLGFNPIMLVGQNCAFERDQYYSKGIDYGMFGEKGSGIQYDLSFTFKVEGVQGEAVYTTSSLNKFRTDFEEAIVRYKDASIINTTKEGAKIAGTWYEPLEKVISDRLTYSVVEDNWYTKAHGSIDKKHMIHICRHMENQYKLLNEIFTSLNLITQNAEKEELGLHLDQLLSIYNNLIVNDYFKAFIYPMNFHESECLVNKIRELNKNNKAQDIFESLYDFLMNCRNDIITSYNMFCNVKRDIDSFVENKLL
mgnify:CR=1 FL=1